MDDHVTSKAEHDKTEWVGVNQRPNRRFCNTALGEDALSKNVLSKNVVFKLFRHAAESALAQFDIYIQAKR